MLGVWWAATHNETFDIEEGGGLGASSPQDTLNIEHMLGVWWAATLQETFDIESKGGSLGASNTSGHI